MDLNNRAIVNIMPHSKAIEQEKKEQSIVEDMLEGESRETTFNYF